MFLRVKEIFQKDALTLVIRWHDDSESWWDVRQLRLHCPCAYCQRHSRQQQRAGDDDLDQITTRPVKIVSCGSYALRIEFDDGHRSGIYPLETLQNLSKQWGTYSPANTDHEDGEGCRRITDC